MKLYERMKSIGYDAHVEKGPINIVAFGDSVTHGCFQHDEFDFEAVYHEKLVRMLRKESPYFPINMINSGIGGITAKDSVKRLQRDVLCYHPDLVIVCFGLNDVNFPIEDYEKGLRDIFAGLLAYGTEVIFMTPNTMNTYINHEVTLPVLLDLAANTAGYQTDGTMDRFMESAVRIAGEFGIPVCDNYAEWKGWMAEGKDTTLLLENGVNHPNRELHTHIAEKLYEMIIRRE